MKYHGLFILSLLTTLTFGQKAELVLPEGHNNALITGFTIQADDVLSSTGLTDKAVFECRWDIPSGRLIQKKSTDIRSGNSSRRPFFVTSDQLFKYDFYNGTVVPFSDSSKLETPFSLDGIANDGQSVFTYEKGAVSIYDYPTYELVKRVQLPTLDTIARFDAGWLSGDHRFFITGLFVKEAGVKIWDLKSQQLLYDAPTLPEHALAIDFHPSEHHLLVNYCPNAEGGQENTVSPSVESPKCIVGRFNLATLSIDKSYDFPLSLPHNGVNVLSTAPKYAKDGAWIIGLNSQGTLVSVASETGAVVHEFRAKMVAPVRFSIPSSNKLMVYDLPPLPQKRAEYSNAHCWQLDRITQPISTQKVRSDQIPASRYLAEYFSDLYPDEFDMNDYREYSRTFSLDSLPLPSDGLRLATMNRRSDAQKNSYYKVYDINELYFYRAEAGETVVHKALEIPANLQQYLGIAAPLAYAVFGQERLALSINGYLRLYDGEGQLLARNSVGGTRSAELHFDPSGRFIFDLKADGSITISDTSLTELGRLIFLEDQQWAVVSPEGAFDAAPETFQDLYFKVYDQNGKLEFIELEQMKERFYDPGLLQKILGYSESPIRNTKGLDQVALYPKADLKLAGDSLFIRLQPRNGGIGRVALFANGKELDYDLRKTTTDSNMVVDLGLAKYQRFLLHENVISIQTFNESESLHSPNNNIEYLYSKGPKVSPRGGGNSLSKEGFSEAVAQSANLHVVCIGTSNYAGENIDLTYPDLDANAMSKALYLVGNQLFGIQNEVFVHCLTTQPKDSARAFLPDHVKWQFASRENIKATLEALQTTTRAQDVVVVYFSGHGKTISIQEKEQFHYLTEQAYTIDLLDKSLLGDITISTAELTDWLKKVPAYKQVVIIDACNAGQAINDLSGGKNINSSQRRALDRMSGRAGMYLLAGSADNMKSYEASNYGQGLLTYALLEGMSGQALEVDEKADSNYFISVSRLFDFAQRRVPELAKQVGQTQEPQFTFPSKAGTFDVGIYNKATPIKPAGAKPILINPVFVSDYFLLDTLGVAEQVARYLRLENQKGAKAAFIFVDDNQFPNAYELRGSYSLKADGKIWVSLYLSHPNGKPLEIKVPPGNTKTIADDIVWELTEVLIKLKEND